MCNVLPITFLLTTKKVIHGLCVCIYIYIYIYIEHFWKETQKNINSVQLWGGKFGFWDGTDIFPYTQDVFPIQNLCPDFFFRVSSICLFLGHKACGIFSFPTRDQTHTPCCGSMESQQLNCQGSSPNCFKCRFLELHKNLVDWNLGGWGQ